MLVRLLRFFAAAILVTGCAFPKAEAAKLWRKVPVTEYEKIHRLHSPGISDIEVGIDGVIYAITNGGLQRWDNYRWFTVDRDPEPLRWNEKENRYYAKVRTSPIGERPQGDFVPMIEPDRMIGIAKRFAIDSAGQFWVTTTNGRVFKGVANDWKREDIMASEVIAGPKGQLVAWSINPAHRQRETEHKDWMKENPHPKWFNGTTWIDLDHIPVPFATMTFDSKGSLWLLASEGTVEHRPGRVFRRTENTWKEMPSVSNARHIESDEHGTVWVVSYSMSHNQTDGWAPANTRFHQWRDGEWYDDPSIPDFPTPTRISSYFHGSLIRFQGNLTFAHTNRWVSLLTVSEEEFDRVQAQRRERFGRSRDKPEEKDDPEEDETLNPFRSPGFVNEVPQRRPDSPVLVGCWQWSNGVFVKAFEDGRIHSGLFKTNWKPGKDDHHFIIEWPSIRDTWTLSNDGQRFTAITSLKVQQSGRKLLGDSTSAEGRWQRNDGAVLLLNKDGTVTSGPYQGRWSQTGSTKVVLEWPIVDEIIVAPDGQSLRAQTQFQVNSATRDSDCQSDTQ